LAKPGRQLRLVWYRHIWLSLSSFFGPGKIAGDVRSAVIGSITSAIGTLIGAYILVSAAPLTFVVEVNSDGFAQPKALFDVAQKEAPKLKLNFVPANLRNTYVCEFKRVQGSDWEAMVIEYLDAYRECFDVSRQGDNTFSIYPNNRTNRLTKKQGAYLCKCPS
jgi:hypothetical protein